MNQRFHADVFAFSRFWKSYSHFTKILTIPQIFLNTIAGTVYYTNFYTISA